MPIHLCLLALLTSLEASPASRTLAQAPIAPAQEPRVPEPQPPEPQPASATEMGAPVQPQAPAAPADYHGVGAEELVNMDLQELLDMQVELATRKATKVESAPSIVTVITRDEIEALGHRHAMDIMRSVPGFEFGMDVAGMVGQMFRGVWVQEGKALVMINGLPLNDLGYGNVNFFANTPASMVERVEIIRGPGSALYGSFAELAVINFVTRKGSDVNGIRASGAVTSVDGHDVGYTGEVSFGGKFGEAEVSASIGYLKDVYSERLYNDFFGNSLKMGMDNAYGQWDHVVAQASLKGLKVNYKRTNMTHSGQDSFAAIVPRFNGLDTELLNNFWEGAKLEYTFSPVEALRISPALEAARGNSGQTSLYAGGIFGGQFTTGTDLERYRAEILAAYDFGVGGELTAGLGYQRDALSNVGVGVDPTNTSPYPVITIPGVQRSDDSADLGYTKYTESKYALLQYIAQIPDVGIGLTAGGRFDDTTFGNAFAPRAGITFAGAGINAKLLYGRAFRIPLPWQAYGRFLAWDGKLKPETSNTYEVELGYKFLPTLAAKANAFFIDVDLPIVYLGGSANTYVNVGRIQSVGAEAELVWREPSYSAFVNASYFEPGPNTSKTFRSARPNRFLGMAPFKLNAGGYYRLSRFEVGPSFTLLSPRTGQSARYALAAAADQTILSSRDGADGHDYPALFLFNVNLIARNIFSTTSSTVDVNFSVHNLFAASYVLVQPYYSAHAPLPFNDRQMMLNVVWNLS